MARTRDRPDVRLFAEIGVTDRLVTARLEASLPDGMSAAQFAVLTHFARQGGARTPVQLARAVQVTKGAMTNTLQRLEARGLVSVVPAPDDGRSKLVSMTPAGAGAYEAAIAALRPYYAGLREAFADAEFEAALPFLRRLRTWLDDNR